MDKGLARTRASRNRAELPNLRFGTGRYLLTFAAHLRCSPSLLTEGERCKSGPGALALRASKAAGFCKSTSTRVLSSAEQGSVPDFVLLSETDP